MYDAVRRRLEAAGMIVARSLVGNFVTSLDMAGCSVTVSLLDEETKRLWDAPVNTPALRWRMSRILPIKCYGMSRLVVKKKTERCRDIRSGTSPTRMFAAVWIFGIFLIEPAWLASALRDHDEDRYSDALRSGLSPNEKADIFGGNAARIYLSSRGRRQGDDEAVSTCPRLWSNR